MKACVVSYGQRGKNIIMRPNAGSRTCAYNAYIRVSLHICIHFHNFFFVLKSFIVTTVLPLFLKCVECYNRVVIEEPVDLKWCHFVAICAVFVITAVTFMLPLSTNITTVVPLHCHCIGCVVISIRECTSTKQYISLSFQVLKHPLDMDIIRR